MSIRIETYNIEWFNNNFNDDNSLKLSGKSEQKLKAVKQILELTNPDLLTVIEAPNTTTTTGIQSTVKKLENFARWAELPVRKAIIGFPSAGKQEIAVLYNPDKMKVKHAPGGRSNNRSNPPFNGEFFHDTDDDNIKEVYRNYRPPLEAKVTLISGEVFYIMGVHTKSKGIFNSVDQVHLERESRRNRLKLYAECAWIRRRVEDWLKDGKKFAVMGDFNDGPGMDLYEMRYGRSAVELIMGDIFQPDLVLRDYLGKPQWTNYGWKPASARFKDKITGSNVNVLIDHILASSNLPAFGKNPAKVWNPFDDNNLKKYRELFSSVSDHFPVTLDLDL